MRILSDAKVEGGIPVLLSANRKNRHGSELRIRLFDKRGGSSRAEPSQLYGEDHDGTVVRLVRLQESPGSPHSTAMGSPEWAPLKAVSVERHRLARYSFVVFEGVRVAQGDHIFYVLLGGTTSAACPGPESVSIVAALSVISQVSVPIRQSKDVVGENATVQLGVFEDTLWQFEQPVQALDRKNLYSTDFLNRYIEELRGRTVLNGAGNNA